VCLTLGGLVLYIPRSRCGGGGAFTQDVDGIRQIRLRNLQPGIPARPEPANAPAPPQGTSNQLVLQSPPHPSKYSASGKIYRCFGFRMVAYLAGAMEVVETVQSCDDQARVHLPGEVVPAPRPSACAGRPRGHQEALPQEALHREAVAVREMLQGLRGAVGLQSAPQDLWHARPFLRLWPRLLSVCTHMHASSPTPSSP
jgi:hypothetical protein